MDTIEQLYIEKEELTKEAQEHSFTAEMFWRAVCEVEKVIIEKEWLEHQKNPKRNWQMEKSLRPIVARGVESEEK